MNEKTVPVAKPPAEAEVVTLRDGTTVTIRPIRPDDAPRLQEGFERLSPESIFFRFLGHRKELPHAEAVHLATVDYRTRMAFVATREHEGDERLIGVARYAVIEPADQGVAEAAIVVGDAHQGLGLGTILLKRLVRYARSQGVRAFLATIRHDNVRILHFIERSGLPTETKIDGATREVLVRLVKEPAEDIS